jgi:plastocyanin
MDRRAFLRRAAPVAAVGLAGCSGSGDGSDGGDGGDGGDTAAPTTAGGAASPTTPGPTTGTATPPPPGGTETTADGGDGGSAATTVDMEPQGSVTVLVGPGGNLRFDPEFFVLREGGTVTWEWESSGHNVRPSQKPEGVNWAGTPQPPQRTFDAGYTYDWSFQQAGEYAYFCQPHQDFGMVGSFRVEQFP